MTKLTASSSAERVKPASKVSRLVPPRVVTPAPPSPPSAAEQRAIDDSLLRVTDRGPRIGISIDQAADGSVKVIGPEHNDTNGWLVRLEDAFGTYGRAFAMSQLNCILMACQDKAGKIDASAVNGMLAAVEGTRPANETQAMLAVQMAVTHALAMTVLRRAARVDQIPQVDSAGNLAVKLLRTFTMQAEALGKLQRGGEQVVKVVHVHPGGQAIVGNVVNQANGANGVDTGPRGGGIDGKSNQPHAKAELPAPSAEPMPEVWSQDAAREAVPIAIGEKQDALSNARRIGR